MQKKVKIQFLTHQMMTKKAITFLIFIITINVFSQNTDWQLRFSPSLSYKINKKWELDFGYRYSLYKDVSEFKSSNFQFSGKYNITKKMSLEAGYRFTTSYEIDNHRFFGAFKYDYKLKDFTFSSRTQYQYTTDKFDSEYMSLVKDAREYLREKISIDYNVPKCKASFNIGAEVFLKFDNPMTYNRIRYIVGTDYKMKHGTFGLSLFYEDKYNETKTDRFVLNTKYNLSLDELIGKKKKKEKKDKKKNKKKELD